MISWMLIGLGVVVGFVEVLVYFRAPRAYARALAHVPMRAPPSLARHRDPSRLREQVIDREILLVEVDGDEVLARRSMGRRTWLALVLVRFSSDGVQVRWAPGLLLGHPLVVCGLLAAMDVRTPEPYLLFGGGLPALAILGSWVTARFRVLPALADALEG